MLVKDIKDFEGRYTISSTGEVYSFAKSKGHHKGKVLKPLNGSYYLVVSLHKNGISKQYFIHKLVAEAFIPNPNNKPQVNHIDGNKLNNNLENLEWCTQSENQIHANKLGLWKSTEAHKYKASEQGKQMRKLSMVSVRHIREFLIPHTTVTIDAIAKYYNVSRGTIRNIRDSVTYKY